MLSLRKPLIFIGFTFGNSCCGTHKAHLNKNSHKFRAKNSDVKSKGEKSSNLVDTCCELCNCVPLVCQKALRKGFTKKEKTTQGIALVHFKEMDFKYFNQEMKFI
jgi:hypothetical protein